MLRGLWAAYERQLATSPVPTQMASSFVLWGIGDYIAQRIEHYEQATYGNSAPYTPPAACAEASEIANSHVGIDANLQHQQQQQQQQHGHPFSSDKSSLQIDTHRMLLTASFGLGFVGPVGHYWYEGIEAACRRLVPGGGLRFLATKVVLDSAIMGSVYVAAFFAFGSLVLDKAGWSGFVHKMQVDFWPTYAAELAVWPVVQAVNFSKVPVRHQLLVVNTFSLLDAAFISWVGHQQDWFTKIKQRMGP